MPDTDFVIENSQPPGSPRPVRQPRLWPARLTETYKASPKWGSVKHRGRATVEQFVDAVERHRDENEWEHWDIRYDPVAGKVWFRYSPATLTDPEIRRPGVRQ